MDAGTATNAALSMDLKAVFVQGVVIAALVGTILKFLFDAKIEKLRSAQALEMEQFRNFNQKQIEAVKSEHAKGLKIHSVQFEKEFSVYGELWKSIVQLEWKLSGMMPIVDFFEAEKTWIDVAPDRYKAAVKTFRAFIRAYRLNEPFIPPGTKKKCDELYRIAHEVIITVEMEIDRRRRDMPSEVGRNEYKEVQAICERFKATATEVSKLIGDRIGNLYDAQVEN